jgi:hypothetical protein
VSVVRHQISFFLAAASCAGVCAAHAQETPSWTISGGHAQVFAASVAGDSRSFSLSLARDFGATSIGVTGGVAKRDSALPEAVSLVSGSNYSVGAYLARDLSGVDFSIAVDLAGEKGDLTLVPPFGASVPAQVRNRYLSVAASLSRGYGETVRFTPSLSGAWSRAKTTIEVDPNKPLLAPLITERRNEGFSGSAGASFATDLGKRVSAYVAGAAVVAENPASVFSVSGPFDRTSRFGSVENFGGADADVWGEFSAGLSFAFGRTATLSVDATRTAGLVDDFTVLSVGASFRF